MISSSSRRTRRPARTPSGPARRCSSPRSRPGAGGTAPPARPAPTRRCSSRRTTGSSSSLDPQLLLLALPGGDRLLVLGGALAEHLLGADDLSAQLHQLLVALHFRFLSTSCNRPSWRPSTPTSTPSTAAIGSSSCSSPRVSGPHSCQPVSQPFHSHRRSAAPNLRRGSGPTASRSPGAKELASLHDLGWVPVVAAADEDLLTASDVEGLAGLPHRSSSVSCDRRHARPVSTVWEDLRSYRWFDVRCSGEQRGPLGPGPCRALPAEVRGVPALPR